MIEHITTAPKVKQVQAPAPPRDGPVAKGIQQKPTPIPTSPSLLPDPPAGQVPGRDSAEEKIRARAYDIYSSRVRAGEDGDCHSDWCRAEREVAANDPGREPIGRELR